MLKNLGLDAMSNNNAMIGSDPVAEH